MSNQMYKDLYFKLFNEITSTIERLKAVQQQAEEIVTANKSDSVESVEA